MNSHQTLQLEVEMLTKPAQRYFLKLDHFPILIGRNPHAEVFIPHQSISLRHLQLIMDQGQLFAVDLSSSKGTFFENQALIPFKPIPINLGDSLTLGKICRIKIVPEHLQFQITVAQEFSPSSHLPMTHLPITQETLEADESFEGWVLLIKNRSIDGDQQSFYVPYDSEISLCLLSQSISLLTTSLQNQKHEKIELKSTQNNLMILNLSTNIKINQVQVQAQAQGQAQAQAQAQAQGQAQPLVDGDSIEWGHFSILVMHYHSMRTKGRSINQMILIFAFLFSLCLFLYTYFRLF